MMRHFVIGTAGHIDHGKTSLVRALTGVDCDRLEEEKRRGITIELGFAPWPIAPDLVASIVDVPGHERLVRTMVAGATGMDAVMLVVAADDGVMPQTREHLDVLGLLGLQRGVVVLTKCDLVTDEELLELVHEDVRSQTQATFLSGAPILRVSCKTGAGLAELKEAVTRLADGVAQRPRTGPALLPLDRAFNIAGHGRVGTGTLVRGALRVEDTVEIFAEGVQPIGELRVRGLQSLGEDCSEVVAGMRTAVNLAGRGSEDVGRGMAVATAGAFVGCEALLVSAAVLPSAGAPLRDEQLTVHLGTTERAARTIPLGCKSLAPGDQGMLLLRLDGAVPAFAGQHFVLRRPGVHGQATVAGGEVLDPEPPRGKRAVSVAAQVAVELQRSPAERLLALAQESRAAGIGRRELQRRLPPETVEGALQGLLAQGALVAIDGAAEHWLATAFCDARVAELAAAVRDYETAHPLEPGLLEAEIEGALDPPERHLAATLVAHAIKAGRLVRGGTVLASPGRASEIDPETRALGERIAAIYIEAKLTPPSDAELVTRLELVPARGRELLALLRRQHVLEKVGDELHAHALVLRALEETVAAALCGGRTITAAEFKDVAGGISRKFAIPLLEYLDRQRVTLRQGNVRRLHPSRTQPKGLPDMTS